MSTPTEPNRSAKSDLPINSSNQGRSVNPISTGPSLMNKIAAIIPGDIQNQSLSDTPSVSSMPILPATPPSANLSSNATSSNATSSNSNSTDGISQIPGNKPSIESITNTTQPVSSNITGKMTNSAINSNVSDKSNSDKDKPPEIDLDKLLPDLPKDWFAGILSLFMPGLGQISQGRYGKGILFFACLHGLFLYGMMLGHWKNVWIPRNSHDASSTMRFISDLKDRPHFCGQMMIGVLTWPAFYQYIQFDEQNVNPGFFASFERAPSFDEINQLQRDNNKSWDLAWVYTVIAGLLNLLVIYDAIAGPAFREVPSDILQKALQAATVNKTDSSGTIAKSTNTSTATVTTTPGSAPRSETPSNSTHTTNSVISVQRMGGNS